MKRTQQQLIIEFLEIALTGAKKTELVYKSFTNFKVTKFYINLLLKNEFLERIGAPTESYKTTEEGKSYLKFAKSLILKQKEL